MDDDTAPSKGYTFSNNYTTSATGSRNSPTYRHHTTLYHHMYNTKQIIALALEGMACLDLA